MTLALPEPGVLGSGLPINALVDGTVGTPSPEWKEMSSDRDLVRTIYGGTEIMQMRSDLLRKEEGESERAYQIRLSRTILYNGVKRTVKTIAGKPFTQPVQWGDEVDREIDDWLDTNIDYTGRSLHKFARSIFNDALIDGISYILVDSQAAPKDEEGRRMELTRADAKASGKRVYWIQYTADDVIGWLSELRGGTPVLTQVRIRESWRERDSLFGEKTVKKIRVLYPGYWEVYRELDTDDPRRTEGQFEYVLEDFGPTDLNYIPLVPIITEQTGFMMAQSPLKDLAWINLKHWQGGSDQAHILHVSRVPWYFGSGFQLKQGEKLVIGPNYFHSRKEKEAKIHVIEHKGEAIGAGRQDQQDSKTEMAELGMELLRPQSPAVTATQIAKSSEQSESPAQAMARDLADALSTAVCYTEDLKGVKRSGAKVSVFTDFALSMLADSSISELRASVEKGILSYETYWEELQRRGELSEKFTPEQEWERLDEQEERMMAGAANMPNSGPAVPDLDTEEDEGSEGGAVLM